MMMRIILDTNSILTSVKYKVDLKHELSRLLDCAFRICVLDRTFDELQGKKDEKIALALLKKWGVGAIKTGGGKNVDQLILDMENEGIMVVTQDKKLKEKLKKREIPVIVIRQKRYLQRV